MKHTARCWSFSRRCTPDLGLMAENGGTSRSAAYFFCGQHAGEDKMSRDMWDKPIELMIDSDHFRSVGNSRDAIAYLMSSWPTKGGKSFSAARRACLGAIDGKVDSATAKLAFIRAAEEAGILRP
uniref:DUF982 domain-containing protein n=2 Tax=Rhizobium lentis TaxID=1138194 RepID=UPI00287F81C1|nr:DUF982 domain-containing protein [Rhizobium lentis]